MEDKNLVIIDDIKSNWFKVKDIKNNEGWCFGGYLNIYNKNEWIYKEIKFKKIYLLTSTELEEFNDYIVGVENIDKNINIELLIPKEFIISGSTIYDNKSTKIGEFSIEYNPDKLDINKKPLTNPYIETIEKHNDISNGKYNLNYEIVKTPYQKIMLYLTNIDIFFNDYIFGLTLYENVTDSSIKYIKKSKGGDNINKFLLLGKSVDLVIL